jgi:hypothetical protein
MDRHSITKAYHNAQARLAKYKETAQETLGEAIAATEVGGASFLSSYGRGKFGDAEGRWVVSSVDVDLAGAVVLHGVAFMNLFGKYDEHAHNLANGMLACYLAHKGFDLGRQSKTSAQGIINELPQARPGIYSGSAFEGAFARA